ncbi:MAG: guanylate kinase [Patescibacteria group bacterium]
MSGKYVVITGPSGAGKTTIVEWFLGAEPACARLVTTTTRAPRPGECRGVDYHFTSVEDFKSRIQAEEFLEHEANFDEYYGSSRIDLAKLLALHPIVFGVLDPKGAATVKRKMPESSVVMLVSSFEELGGRLKRRFGADSPKVQRRLKEAEREMADTSFCEFVMQSHDGELDRMVAILRGNLARYLGK